MVKVRPLLRAAVVAAASVFGCFVERPVNLRDARAIEARTFHWRRLASTKRIALAATMVSMSLSESVEE